MASVTQCFAVTPGVLATMGAKILTTHSDPTSSASVAVSSFSTPDCSGTALARTSAEPRVTSYGIWILATTSALASPAAHSVRAELSATAYGTTFFGGGRVEAVADDATFTLAAVGTTTSILPSAAWVHGAGGSYWKTRFTLCNPGPTDAVVTLKWLGHDVDGRGGPETAYVVHAGRTFVPDENTWWSTIRRNYDAILVTRRPRPSSSRARRLRPPQAAPSARRCPRSVPRTSQAQRPRRSHPSARTPPSARTWSSRTPQKLRSQRHVAVFNSDGTLLGSRDVDLAPFGMTQINRVAAALGASTVDLGRIAVSTATPAASSPPTPRSSTTRRTTRGRSCRRTRPAARPPRTSS